MPRTRCHSDNKECRTTFDSSWFNSAERGKVMGLLASELTAAVRAVLPVVRMTTGPRHRCSRGTGVRAHQAVRMHFQPPSPNLASESSQKLTLVAAGLEVRPLSQGPVDHMVPTAGPVESGSSGHGALETPWPSAGFSSCGTSCCQNDNRSAAPVLCAAPVLLVVSSVLLKSRFLAQLALRYLLLRRRKGKSERTALAKLRESRSAQLRLLQ